MEPGIGNSARPMGIVLAGVCKTFRSGSEELAILTGVDWSLEPGTSAAILGPSGSGKSTLLHLLGGLDRPTAGRIEVAGRCPHALSGRELARFRGETVGFVFQDHHLLPQCNVLENVCIPYLATPTGVTGSVDARARALLAMVGLEDRLRHRPAELSGGERQRVAIARALVRQPTVLLGDEPTGNLDAASASRVADLLFDLPRTEGVTLVVVTHSMELARRAKQRFQLQHGRLEPC